MLLSGATLVYSYYILFFVVTHGPLSQHFFIKSTDQFSKVDFAGSAGLYFVRQERNCRHSTLVGLYKCVIAINIGVGESLLTDKGYLGTLLFVTILMANGPMWQTRKLAPKCGASLNLCKCSEFADLSIAPFL